MELSVIFRTSAVFQACFRVRASWLGCYYPCMDSTRCNRSHPTLIRPQKSNRCWAEVLKVKTITVPSDELVHFPPSWPTGYPTMQRACLLLRRLLPLPPPLFFFFFTAKHLQEGESQYICRCFDKVFFIHRSLFLFLFFGEGSMFVFGSHSLILRKPGPGSKVQKTHGR